MTHLVGYLTGVAIAVSVVAIILALWPAVADAPWETKSGQEIRDRTFERCLALSQAVVTSDEGDRFVDAAMERLNCVIDPLADAFPETEGTPQMSDLEKEYLESIGLGQP